MKRKEKPPLVAIGLYADRSNAQYQAARYRQPGLVSARVFTRRVKADGEAIDAFVMIARQVED